MVCPLSVMGKVNHVKMWLKCVLLLHHQAVGIFVALQWRHNERDGVSNHQPRDCLLNRLFRYRSKKTPKLRVTGLCEKNSPVTGDFPTQKPVTRKMFPCDDVIMNDVLQWIRAGIYSLCCVIYDYRGEQMVTDVPVPSDQFINQCINEPISQ